jgi:CubicO group peptidase (beta-lactamase class C family)
VFKPIALEELVRALATAPLDFQPGSRWQYSFSHDVQAYLVERFSGMRFDRFLEERVFEPLGMKNTAFGVPNGAVERLVTTYGPPDRKEDLLLDGPLPAGVAAFEDPKTSPYLGMAGAPAGGHGLVSTAEDYFRFSQMLLNGGEFNGRRILSRKTVELMTANHLPAGTAGLFEGGIGYGLGVSVLTDIAASGNLGSEGQFGWGGAASTSFFIDPREQLVAVLMVQYRPAALDLARQFQTLVYQAIDD